MDCLSGWLVLVMVNKLEQLWVNPLVTKMGLQLVVLLANEMEKL